MDTILNPSITKKYTCNINITDLCNMSCPWCINDFNMNNDKRVIKLKTWSKETKEKFFKHIQKVPYREFAMLGGEPLLFPEEVFSTCIRIRELLGKETKFKIYTNGSLITKEIANKLNELNIRCLVALNFYGYKGLENLFMCSKDMDIIKNIKSLKTKNIRLIFGRKEKFGIEALMLSRIFECVVDTCPDFRTLKDWDDTDIEHIEQQLYLINSFDKNLSWFGIGVCGTKYCPCCDKPDPIYADGIRRRPTFSTKNYIYGCGAALEQMGPEMYNKFVVTVRNYIPYTRNDQIQSKGEYVCPL